MSGFLLLIARRLKRQGSHVGTNVTPQYQHGIPQPVFDKTDELIAVPEGQYQEEDDDEDQIERGVYREKLPKQTRFPHRSFPDRARDNARSFLGRQADVDPDQSMV